MNIICIFKTRTVLFLKMSEDSLGQHNISSVLLHMFGAIKLMLLPERSRRKEIVLNLDTEPQEGLWSAAIRRGDLELIWGQDKLLKQKVGNAH